MGGDHTAMLEHPLLALMVALAVGLLVGVERGWRRRDAEEGRRVAGVRTYALLGLLGGVIGILWRDAGVAVFGFGLLAVTIVLVVAYALSYAEERDSGITSAVAALLTFVFGAVAGLGHADLAGAGAVAMVILLGLKPELHAWLQRISRDELKALFTLLLISVVLLPVLPDRDFGPWGAWNPREIWLLVVLIAGLSFGGYIAVRLAGPQRGLLATGIFGGLASSTALTLHFSRLARHGSDAVPVLAAGVLFACSTVFLRMIIVIGVVNYTLLPYVLPPFMAMTVVGLLGATWLASRAPGIESGQSPLRNPIELGTALAFGLLLATILLLTAAFEAWFGSAGVLVLAGMSGLADVDAITISLARLAAGETAMSTAVIGIVIAAAANNISKAVLAAMIGGRRLAVSVVPVLLLMTLAGPALLAAVL